MKIMKRMLSIVFILALLIQSSSLAFALSGSEQKSYKTDNKKIDQAEVEKLVKEVQAVRKKEGKVSYSKKELAKIEQAEKRADILPATEEKIQAQINALKKKSSSKTKSSSNLSASFSGGDGSEQNPYTITTPEQMAYIAQDLSACYSLTKDINMSGISWTPIGPFTGKFNGDGHKISNLKIESTASTIGLFGTCNGATLENIKLQDADIRGSNTVAAFAGVTTNTVLRNLSIESSKVSGAGYVGGIVAAGLEGTEIYECSNDGTVTATGEISGGIVATMNGTTLEDCVFKGTITGTNYVAGIAGLLQNNTFNCTNAGSVSGNDTIGGISALTGCLGKDVYVYYCYNNGKVSGKTEVAGIIAFATSTENGMLSIYYDANSGDITATENYAGGITGDSACDLYISKCYNTGKVYADSIYGGLVGRLNVSIAYDGALINSYNAGIVAKRDDNDAKAGSLIGHNCGILVKQIYYLPGYASAVGYHEPSFYGYTATLVNASDLRSIQNTIGTPFIADTEWINRGYPIIDGINYTFSAGHKADYPTVVIPGIIGSELYDGDSKLWFSISTANVKKLELNQDGESVNDVTVSDMDDYGTMDIYEKLVTSLEQEYGNEEVYFFPYDWRLGNADSADKLSEYIDKVVCAPRVNIVAHSMGGLVAARYIKGNSQNVNKFISLGTPYLGSPKVPYVFSTGQLVFFDKIPGIDIPVYAFTLRKLSPHMTSAYQLLPYKAPNKYIATWGSNGMENCDNEFNYIKNNLHMIGLNDETISSTVKETFLNKSTPFMESIHTPLSNKTGKGSISSSAIELVDSYVIAGTGKETISKTIYNTTGEYVADLEFESGDATVPDWSANINGLVPTKRYNLEHTELVSEPEVIAKVKGMLNGNEPEYSYSLPEGNNEYVVLRVAAQADVSISHGDEKLTNIDGKQNAETDFGSMYIAGENEDIIIFALSADKTYDIEMDSFESDVIDYDIRFFNSKNKLIEERSFNDLSVTKDTNITTDISRKKTVLSMDMNNNGVIDKKIKPDKINH